MGFKICFGVKKFTSDEFVHNQNLVNILNNDDGKLVTKSYVQ